MGAADETATERRAVGTPEGVAGSVALSPAGRLGTPLEPACPEGVGKLMRVCAAGSTADALAASEGGAPLGAADRRGGGGGGRRAEDPSFGEVSGAGAGGAIGLGADWLGAVWIGGGF